MITDKQAARQVSEKFLAAGKLLDEACAAVQAHCPADEWERFRRVAGGILGDMLLNVMNPLYREHPDLKPDGLR